MTSEYSCPLNINNVEPESINRLAGITNALGKVKFVLLPNFSQYPNPLFHQLTKKSIL